MCHTHSWGTLISPHMKTRPDSSLRYRRYINHLLTYLLTVQLSVTYSEIYRQICETDLRQEVASNLQSRWRSFEDVPHSVVEVVRDAVQRSFQLTVEVDWTLVSPATTDTVATAVSYLTWDYITHQLPLQSQIPLYPVYTIQPVVKPFDNRLNVCIHNITRSQTGLTSSLTTGCIV